MTQVSGADGQAPTEPPARVPWGKAALSLIVAVPLMLWSEVSYFAGLQSTAPAPYLPTPLPSGSADESAGPVAYTDTDRIPVLFHPETGESLVWFSGDLAESPRFFTRPGFDPANGEPLQHLTREALTRHQRARHERLKRETEEAKRQREASFRAQFVDESALNELSDTSHSVLLALDDKAFEREFATALGGLGLVVRSDVLRDDVFEPAPYSELTVGNRGFLKRLRLTSQDATLLLGRLELEVKQNRQVRRVVTATARLSVVVVPLQSGAPVSIAISEPGAGFDEPTARSAAKRSAIEALLEHPSPRASAQERG